MISKIRILFTYLIITSTSIAFSQQITNLNVIESPEYKDKVKSEGVLAIHTSSSGLTGIVRSSKKNLLFDIFDKDLKKTFNKLVESSKKERFVGDLFFGDEIKVFTVLSPKKRERILYCHTFNLENKTYKKVELFSTTVEKNQSLFSIGRNKRQTSFAISPNGDYFAISTDNIKKNLNAYTIRVYNSNSLSLVFKKSYQEHAEKYFEPNDIVMDNSGTVYAVGKQFIKGRKEKKKGEANYTFVVNSISKEANKSLKVNLGEDEHIRSLVLRNDNQLKLLGFYSESRSGRIKGACSFTIDKGFNAVVDKKLNILPTSVYEDLYGYRKAKRKKGKELSNFYIDYVVEDSKGNTFLLAEEFYITQHYVSNGMNGGYWRTVYHYDDILILKFNAKGNLDWGRSVFKRSNSPSYNAFLKDDKLHVLLNSGKRLSEKKDGRTKVSKGWFESSSLYDFEYAASGETMYNKIQDNKGQTYYLPFFGTYSNGKFIMMSSGRKKKRFMSLY